MKVEARKEQGVTILSPTGKITIGVGDVALREAVHDALDSGERHILINLEQVTTIDSSGIGEMVSAFTTVTNRGGKLKLVNVPEKVTDILQMTQLITVFEVHTDMEEAIASF